ncbi:hypothetical protein C8Q80DRAFT_718172 [Daedaleopsis nitida]|nr:hypothetical protein C8Q80DRAFT_718172 [Daedaleopsis nitida]
MGDGEYEVESILGAKVVRGHRGKKSWLFFVKWKNFGDEDNTWEPYTSFKGGSEHFIQQFWDRVTTDGRDPEHLAEFKLNEEFYPSGPPRKSSSQSSCYLSAQYFSGRKKGKKEQSNEEEKEALPDVEIVDSENEVHSIIDIQAPPAPKLKRRRSSVGVEAEATAPKRKRKGPPGIRASEMQFLETSINDSHPTPKRRGESSQTRAAAPTAGYEPEHASSSRRSSTRKRGLPANTPRQSSPSSDELLLGPVEKKKTRHRSRKEASPTENAMAVDDNPPSLFAPSKYPPLPRNLAHRARTARVKQTDDPNLTETQGAIAVKAQFMKRTNRESAAEASSSRPARVAASRPGPGRSSSGLVGGSLLTSQNGELTVVKPRKHRPVQQDPNVEVAALDANELVMLDTIMQPAPPPTGPELLEAAGFKLAGPVADELPDFEQDVEVRDEANALVIEAPGRPSVSQDVESSQVSEPVEPKPVEPKPVEQAPETPAIVLEARPLTFAKLVSTAWTNSTIFGPLNSSEDKKHTLYLNLDSAVSVPIMLKDIHASQSFLDGLDAMARNPTGKFYKSQHAIALVSTLVALGSHARFALADGAGDDQKAHLERFISRLEAGELFIQMNRAETLAMCASSNSDLAHKLGFPAQLLGLGNTAIVAHVNVENYCEYAEAAVHADNSRW